MNNPLISIIITARNEGEFIENLLLSIKKQTYKNIETIVVDNNSDDQTVQIAKNHGVLVATRGPERSAQRNYGAKKSKGDYLLFLDADMVLSPDIVEKCVLLMAKDNTIGGLIIPENTVGVDFWAKVKAFERSFYVGDDAVEAARFFPRKIFYDLDGYDEGITGPEDWDFSQRVRNAYGISRINSFIVHNEGKITLLQLMKKKYYYGKSAKTYLSKNKMSTFSPQTVFFLRKAFYKKPQQLFLHPILTIAMCFMLSVETIAGALGFYIGK